MCIITYIYIEIYIVVYIYTHIHTYREHTKSLNYVQVTDK